MGTLVVNQFDTILGPFTQYANRVLYVIHLLNAGVSGYKE